MRLLTKWQRHMDWFSMQARYSGEELQVMELICQGQSLEAV